MLIILPKLQSSSLTPGPGILRCLCLPGDFLKLKSFTYFPITLLTVFFLGFETLFSRLFAFGGTLEMEQAYFQTLFSDGFTLLIDESLVNLRFLHSHLLDLANIFTLHLLFANSPSRLAQ